MESTSQSKKQNKMFREKENHLRANVLVFFLGELFYSSQYLAGVIFTIVTDIKNE